MGDTLGSGVGSGGAPSTLGAGTVPRGTPGARGTVGEGGAPNIPGASGVVAPGTLGEGGVPRDTSGAVCEGDAPSSNRGDSVLVGSGPSGSGVAG